MAGKPMFYTVRKHWKKSLCAAILSSYGAMYVVDKYREYVLRREFCAKVLALGHTSVNALQLPRRLHLILNPQASNGNAVKLFEKNSAPLLHLAGIDVTVIRTDYEGHAKAIVGYIDPNTDAIIVAGGDGTVQEVVTGLMREKDDEFRKIPIGIIPLGKENNFFNRVLFRRSRQAEQIGDATLAVIKGDIIHTDVLEISAGKKKSYGLNSIHWGMFQQVKEKIDAKKHWWAGPWRKEMACVTRTIKNWPFVARSEIAFSSKVGSAGVVTSNESSSSTQCVSMERGNRDPGGRGVKVVAANAVDQNRTAMEGDATGVSAKSQVIDILAVHANLCNDENNMSYMALEIWRPGLSRTDFIKDGFAWIRSYYQPIHSPHADCFRSEWLQLVPLEDQGSFYHIDGEMFEAVPVTVALLRNKLRLFSTATGS